VLRQRTGDTAVSAATTFDLIAGTSTGGILAAALTTPDGRLGDDGDREPRSFDLYRTLAGEVFPTGRRLVRGLPYLAVGEYSGRPLERLLSEQLGEDIALHETATACSCPVYDLDGERRCCSTPTRGWSTSAAKSGCGMRRRLRPRAVVLPGGPPEG
jgi:patatin-like phospholipase/acyl hydrolase